MIRRGSPCGYPLFLLLLSSIPSGLKAIIFASGNVCIVEQDEQSLYLHGGDVTIIEGKMKEVEADEMTEYKVEVEPVGEEPEDEIFRQHNAFDMRQRSSVDQHRGG